MTKNITIPFIICLAILVMANSVSAQLVLRDTVITWQHHQFELNEDYSMKSYSTSDSDIQQVEFSSGKVIENDLIRLVLLPEYGGRVLSFYYKPTDHEYLYQSEVGSAYGIGDNNFYYNWLMVYGGIFPTFPEPEHGKTWLVPWDYSVIEETSEKITVRMEYADNTSYSGAPGQFNNGITNITCKIDITVYRNSSLWDFNVTLVNNEASTVKYEYWTCTTLAPGSESGDTGTPLNSELVIPVDKYFAGWSPRGWIGNFNSYYDYTRIDHLSEWDDMGIAYADALDDVYWGVINHENEEGIFRISDNVETYGVKLWTWGKDNVDNNMYDWSNGGADNYIELWAGVSESFFTDALLSANEVKSWNEAYYPTIGLSSIDNMNDLAAVNLNWDEEESKLEFQLNTFNSDDSYYTKLYVDDENIGNVLYDDFISFAPLGHNIPYQLDELELAPGAHEVRFELYNTADELALNYMETINLSPVLGIEITDASKDMLLESLGSGKLKILMSDPDNYKVQVLSLNGSRIIESEFSGTNTDVQLKQGSVYLISVMNDRSIAVKKIFIN